MPSFIKAELRVINIHCEVPNESVQLPKALGTARNQKEKCMFQKCWI